MSAATTARLTVTRQGKFYRAVPLAAAVNIFSNTVGAVSTSGTVGPVSNGTYNRILGIVEEGADNTAGSAGDKTVEIRRDITAIFENSGTTPVLAAHIGQTVKWEDNQTVAAPATGSLAAGGIIMGITTDGVEIYFP